MFCPKCKQVVVKLVVGVCCGCAMLTGHAEEPLRLKFYVPQQAVQQVAVQSSTAALQPTGFTSTDALGRLIKITPGSTEGSTSTYAVRW